MTTRWKDFDTRSAAEVRAELLRQSPRESNLDVLDERKRLAAIWEDAYGFDKHGVAAWILSGGDFEVLDLTPAP